MARRLVRVAQDGSGDYRTVQEAIDSVPLRNTCRTVISVAPGVYRQPVYVPKTKNLITLAGLRPEDTVISWNNTATKIDHHQTSRVIGTGTFGCGSTIVEGEDFIAENITFYNSAPQGSGQAVAIRVTADRCAFYNCRFLGWQDTLYLHYGKQYLKDCYIEGSVDFIFGNSTALLEHCHIHCKSAGFITAQSRKSPQETTGYVFLSYLKSDFKSSMATVISHGEVAPAVNASEMSLPLTFFDMPWLFYFRMVRRLLFYRLPISRDTFVETTIPNLMTSLSQTLKHFLPVAGNVVSPSDSSTKPELRYVPGDSVSVTFAESAADFNSLVANHPRDVNEFYPFVPRLPEAKHTAGAQIAVPVLAVQVTLFPGFGICIGTTHHHVVGDGNTMNSFTKAWAMISKLGGDAEKSVPVFDRTMVKDPYGAGDIMFEEKKKKFKVEPSEAEISTPRINKVRATYIMRRRDIEKIKSLVAARQRPRTVHVSAFTITCAYVWSSLVKAGVAIGEQTEEHKTEYFRCVADCRSRLNPPLPANYFGNCVAAIFVKSKHGVLVGSEGFLTAAELIGEEIQKRVNDEEWILNGEFWFSGFEEAVVQRAVGVAGYPRIDIYGADFGWGKPEKVEYVSIDGGDSMSLCKCRDSEGDIEVGLAMPTTKMDAFAAIFADGLRNL